MDTLYSSDMGLSSMPFTCEDCNAVFTSRDSYAMHVMMRAKDKSCRSEMHRSDSSFASHGRSDAVVGDSVEIKASLLGLQPTNGKDTLNLVEQTDVPLSEIENCIKEVKQEVISNDGSNIGSPVSMTPKLVVVKTEPENSNNSSKDCSVMEGGSSGLSGPQRRLAPGVDPQNPTRSDSVNTSAVPVRSSTNLGSSKTLINSHHVICLLCDSQFLDQDSLAMHMMSFHAESVAVTRSQSNNYRDHTNDSSYSSLQHFDLSPLSHYRRGSMRYRCDECGVGFDNEDFLTLHLISHRRGIQAITTASLLNEHTRAYSHMLENKRKRQTHQTHFTSDMNDSGWSLPIKKPMLQESKQPDISHLGKPTHLPMKNFLNKYSKGYNKAHSLSSDPMDGRSIMGKPLSVDQYRRFYERCGYFASSTNFPTSSSSSSSTASTSSPSMTRCVNDRSQSVPNESKTEGQKCDPQRPHSVGFLEKCQATRNKHSKEARSVDDIDHRGGRELSTRIKDGENRLRKSSGAHSVLGKGPTLGDPSSSKERSDGETPFYENWTNPNSRKEKNNHLIISSVRTLPKPSHVEALDGNGNSRTEVISSQAQQQQQQGKQEHCVSSSNGCDTAFSGLGSSADILRELKGRLQDAMMCKHCDVIFLNRTLYHLHMGLHNVNNPWQCNICGRACNDVHDFTAHVIHFWNVRPLPHYGICKNTNWTKENETKRKLKKKKKKGNKSLAFNNKKRRRKKGL